MAKDAKSKKFIAGLSKRKDIKSAEAIGAMAGMKKLGNKNFQKRAAAGRKKGK